MFPRLQYITDSPPLAEQACRAGVKWIQARIKDEDEKTWKEIANDIVKICKVYGVMCIVNDSPEIAMHVKADGVHLGKKDMQLPVARKILENHKMIIGGSANTAEDIIHLAGQKVDYMGLGPLRFTSTKKDLNPVLGMEEYKRIMKEVKRSSLTIPPIYAIGGVNVNDVKGLLSAGVYGTAVSSAICESKNMNHALREFYSALGEQELNI